MLLVQVAKRFEEIVRSKDLVARLGGDEFVIISEHIRTNEDAIHLAKRLVDNLAKPYVLDGNTVIVAASVGIAIAPDNGTDPVTLLKNADLALYRAKAESRGSFRFFETNMDAELQLRRDLESDLRDAVIRGGFAMHYQPQYDLNTNTLVGYEALVRWPHPTKGFIPPGEFIALAEETGLIIPMGEWILRRACLDAQVWPEHVKVAVNLSPAQFMKNDVASMVKRIIFETGIDPRRLELEITESLLLQDTDNILEQLTVMRNLGVTIAMDDFGTGYSSLSYLSRFPFDKIKIDQTFVQSLDKDPSVAAIVNSIVGLGKTLSMTVIAEGVENETQAQILRDAGCKHVQGFLFGKPVPTSNMETPKSYSEMLREIVEESRAREVPEQKKEGETKVA
jgi:predicted signal transduction protein with EAL and GGDEF domain